jgi:hypothetical protein
MTVLQKRLLLDDKVCKSRPRQDDRQIGDLISSRQKLFVLTSSLSGAEVERRVGGSREASVQGQFQLQPPARRQTLSKKT